MILFVQFFARSKILEVLSIKARTKLGQQGPCALFFDEIQAVPNLIKHLRYFKEDYPHMHVVAAGSSLELALKNIGSFPVGRVVHLFMKPLDFEEFLWARDESFLAEILATVKDVFDSGDRESFMKAMAQKTNQVHSRLVNLALEYELCGGMPAVVQKFLATSDLVACRDIQQDIMTSFRDDFSKYVKDSIITKKVRENIDAVLRNIGDLAKRVVFSRISSSHADTVKKAIDLLEDIGLVYRVYHTSAFDSPLSSGMDGNDYRLFLCDSGLFHALTNSSIPDLISPDIHFSNDGILGEYFLITELVKRSSFKRRDHEVYFWENKKKSEGAEIDALLFCRNTLCAVDAKRKRQKVSPSLISFQNRHTKFDNNHKPALLALVSSMDPPGYLRADIVNIPFYMTPFIL